MDLHIHEVIIVGAGLGGIAGAVSLKREGISDFLILERSDGVGGTWRSNSYPGCGCDTQMIAYQYSFSISTEWDSLYPKAPQILQYVENVTDEFEIRPHIRLGINVQRLSWSDEGNYWVIATDQGEYCARAVFMALGQFTTPSIPQLPGLTEFTGHSFHTGNWDHSVDLVGKRIAVVGSAASAVQVIPELAKVATEVLVFQRTPNWIIPRGDRVVSPLEQELLSELPDAVHVSREYQLSNADALLWPIFSYSQRARAYFESLATAHLNGQVKDPVLRLQLTPDYPIGCKRLLLSDDFYPTIQADHVELVDCGVDRVDCAGPVDATGRAHRVDVIVWATGFETRGWHESLPIYGRGGAEFSAVSGESPQTLLGVVARGLPNLFLAYGPNTNLGHGPITFMLERQAEFFARSVAAMTQKGFASVEVRSEVVAAHQAALQDALAGSTWADPSCSSYYKTVDGHITKNWMGSMSEYRAALESTGMEVFETT